MRVDVDGIIRAGRHTGFAGDTLLIVKIHYPVGTDEESASRANRNAGSIVAVVTAQDREVAPDVGERPFFYIFDPGTKLSERHLVFGFARDCASVASDTPTVIN